MHACRGGHINSISSEITVLARNLRLHSILHNRNIANMQAVASCWAAVYRSDQIIVHGPC